MSYIERDKYGMYKGMKEGGPGPRLLGANTMIGDDVYNNTEEKLGDIKEVMIDTTNGEIRYAVLSYGGFMGMGDKLFAVPWQALKLDPANKRFVLNIEKDKLKNAPGFDKDAWPDLADPTLTSTLHNYYGINRTDPH